VGQQKQVAIQIAHNSTAPNPNLNRSTQTLTFYMLKNLTPPSLIISVLTGTFTRTGSSPGKFIGTEKLARCETDPLQFGCFHFLFPPTVPSPLAFSRSFCFADIAELVVTRTDALFSTRHEAVEWGSETFDALEDLHQGFLLVCWKWECKPLSNLVVNRIKIIAYSS
jgi:hypothetical protein